MDLIPVIDRQKYILCDRNLIIVQFTDGVNTYSERVIAKGEDIRTGFPEIIGLESVCEAILSGVESSFVLESITRQDSQVTVYFDLYIKSIDEYLVILLEDVTELMLFKQSFIQRLNEAELSLDKLKKFEYCTNKIIASMRDVLFITSPQGKIERVNKSATELFGRKKSELIDRSIDDLIQDSNFDPQQIYDSLLFSSNCVEKIELNCQIALQKNIQIEFDCFIAPTEVNGYFNCVYIGRDITARKQAEAEIRKSLARERELKELKSGFISMASHEFRNPLSSILLCVQNLDSENNLNESNRKFYLESIRNAALNMNSLLEDILTLSKTESKEQNLKLEPINLYDLCQQIIEQLVSIYTDKKINFNYRVPIDTLNLDRTALRQILSNLLSNALKYSPNGSSVDLNIFYDDRSAKIIIEIRDRGIGIPEESQKHLFESFYRADNVNAITGTGLGLSIVKRVVELYQGSITVNSKINRGTNVVVQLPLPQKY